MGVGVFLRANFPRRLQASGWGTDERRMVWLVEMPKADTALVPRKALE